MQEEAAPEIAKRDALQRFTGNSFILGAVLAVIAGLLHSQQDDRTDLIAVIQEIGDTNGDFVIDVTDLLVVIGDWGPCNPGDCPGDIDNNGVVNVLDLLGVISLWGDPC